MATIEPAPPTLATSTQPTPFRSPSRRSSPCLFPLSAHGSEESERDGFCIQCRCPGWVKRGAEAVAAYRQGVSLFSLGSPTCGRSWPTWVSQLFLRYRTFVAECYYSLCGYIHTRDPAMPQRCLFLMTNSWLTHPQRYFQSRLVLSEKRGTRQPNGV